jgi:hypothetical protein
VKGKFFVKEPWKHSHICSFELTSRLFKISPSKLFLSNLGYIYYANQDSIVVPKASTVVYTTSLN